MSNLIAFFLVIFASTAFAKNAALPTIVADEAQTRPSRLITKNYDPKSPEFEFWSKHRDASSKRARKLADTAIQIQQLSDQLRNHEGVDPDRQKNEAKLQKLNDFFHKQQNLDRLPVPVKFLRWSKEGSTNILNVVLYSQIPDPSFNRRVVDVIESRWQAENYKVKIQLKTPTGEHTDGAFLTAGAQTTHAELGRAIRLGSADLSENVLAHEFGHVLGFRDLYYRSYRQTKGRALEIMEVIPASTDIMGNPEFGKVELRHFQNLKTVNERGK